MNYTADCLVQQLNPSFGHMQEILGPAYFLCFFHSCIDIVGNVYIDL